MTVSLAQWTPFLDPLPNIDAWVLYVIPIVLVIALVYKTLKLNPIKQLFFETIKLASVIMAYLITTAVILWFVTGVLLAG